MKTSIVTELLSLPIFATMFHFIGEKEKPVKIIYAYIVNDLFSSVVCIAVALPTLLKFFREAKLQPEDVAPADNKSLDEEETENDVKVVPEL